MIKDWLKEGKLLIGLVIMIAIGVTIPLTLLESMEALPYILLVFIIIFTIWIIYFLFKDKTDLNEPINSTQS